MTNLGKCPKCGSVETVTFYKWLGRYVCEACGARWDTGSSGYEVIETPVRRVERTVYVCEECGLEQRPGARQCPRCGAEFEKPVPGCTKITTLEGVEKS